MTPLDRDDISDLTSRFDDFVDDLEEVGRRLVLYRLHEPPEPARLLTRILAEQAALLVGAIPHLERVNKEREALHRCILDIHRLENEADDALSQPRHLVVDHGGRGDAAGLGGALGVAGRIVAVWVVTIPVCVLLGWAFYWGPHLLLGVE